MEGIPQSAKFSSDSTRIAARCSKGEVVIWNRETGKEIKRIQDNKSKLENLLDPQVNNPMKAEPESSAHPLDAESTD